MASRRAAGLQFKIKRFTVAPHAEAFRLMTLSDAAAPVQHWHRGVRWESLAVRVPRH